MFEKYIDRAVIQAISTAGNKIPQVRTKTESKPTGIGSKTCVFIPPNNEKWLILNCAVRNDTRAAQGYASWSYDGEGNSIMYTALRLAAGATYYVNPFEGGCRPLLPISGDGKFILYEDAMQVGDTATYRIEYIDVGVLL